MRARQAAFALTLFEILAAAASAQATTYANAHFGYSITYPDDLLIPEREADNGDGRAFHARNGTAKLSVWGANRDDSEATPDAIARLYQADCVGTKPSYSIVRPRLIAFPCMTPAGRIIYQKTLIGGDALRSVRFDYPDSERAVWDPVVRKVSGSLKAK